MFTLLCAISIQILKFFCKDRRLSFYMSRTLHLFGTDWCAMMVPIQVIRWYRMQCYDGTDSCATVVPIRRYCQQAELGTNAHKVFCQRPLSGLPVPVKWAFRDQVMGIDRPSYGHSLPVLRASSTQSVGRFWALFAGWRLRYYA